MSGDDRLKDEIRRVFFAAVHDEKPCPFCDQETNNVYPFCQHVQGCIAHELVNASGCQHGKAHWGMCEVCNAASINHGPQIGNLGPRNGESRPESWDCDACGWYVAANAVHTCGGPKWKERLTGLQTAWKDDEDKPLPEDEDIEAAFPTHTGRHDLYAEALRLVSARVTKGGLVEIVNWLLYRAWQGEQASKRLADVTQDCRCSCIGCSKYQMPTDHCLRAACVPAPTTHNPNIPTICRGCGAPLLLENLFVDDGCPCNTPRGVNLTPSECSLCKTDDCVKPGHRLAKLFGMPYVLSLSSPLAQMTEIDVDGIVDPKGIEFIGKATKQPDGTWRSLANVGGALCVVQVNITAKGS